EPREDVEPRRPRREVELARRRVGAARRVAVRAAERAAARDREVSLGRRGEGLARLRVPERRRRDPELDREGAVDPREEGRRLEGDDRAEPLVPPARRRRRARTRALAHATGPPAGASPGETGGVAREKRWASTPAARANAAPDATMPQTKTTTVVPTLE